MGWGGYGEAADAFGVWDVKVYVLAGEIAEGRLVGLDVSKKLYEFDEYEKFLAQCLVQSSRSSDVVFCYKPRFLRWSYLIIVQI